MSLRKRVMALAYLVASSNPLSIFAQNPTAGATTGSNITGAVLDVSGAVVVGAEVSLIDTQGFRQRSTKSDIDGEFTFTNLPLGSYYVLVNAQRLEPFKSDEIRVTMPDTYRVPRVQLAVATSRTEVNVRPTEMIAQEQIKAEEKQRLLGIIPNFYTSYDFDAAPMNTRQKYSLALRDTLDPMRFVGSAIVAGIQQNNNSFAGYGQGAAGYGKRFAASYGNGLFSDVLSHAVFPALLHQDPRYFYQGSGTKKSRLLHAISFAVFLRGDDGEMKLNYSYLLGDIGAGALSNLYYPHANRGAGLVFTNAAIGIGGRAAGTVLREFVFKRLTTNVHGNGKP